MGLGIALALVATLCWGAGDVFARKAMFNASAEVVLLVTVAMVAAVLGIVGLAMEGADAFVASRTSFYALVALMGFLAYLTGNLFYFHGMRRAGVTVVAPVLGASPLFAILLAVVIGGEQPATATLVGAVAIFVGVGIIMSDRGRSVI